MGICCCKGVVAAVELVDEGGDDDDEEVEVEVVDNEEGEEELAVGARYQERGERIGEHMHIGYEGIEGDVQVELSRGSADPVQSDAAVAAAATLLKKEARYMLARATQVMCVK